VNPRVAAFPRVYIEPSVEHIPEAHINRKSGKELSLHAVLPPLAYLEMRKIPTTDLTYISLENKYLQYP
jgi:hypothetical protein